MLLTMHPTILTGLYHCLLT